MILADLHVHGDVIIHSLMIFNLLCPIQRLKCKQKQNKNTQKTKIVSDLCTNIEL